MTSKWLLLFFGILCGNAFIAQSTMRLNRVNSYPAANNTILPNMNNYRFYYYPNATSILADSIVYYNYNNNTQSFETTTKIIYNYSFTGKVTEEITFINTGAQWEFFRKYNYIYDGQTDMLTQMNEYTWNGSSWNEIRRRLYQVNTTSGIINTTTHLDTVNGVLRNTWRYTNSFGISSGKPFEQTKQTEKFISGAWKVMVYEENTHSFSGNNIRIDSTVLLIRPTDTSANLVLSRTYYYDYNTDNQIIERIEKTSNYANYSIVKFGYEPVWGLKNKEERYYWNQDSADYVYAHGDYFVFDSQQRQTEFRRKFMSNGGPIDERIESKVFAPDSSIITVTNSQFDYNNNTLSLSGKSDFLFDNIAITGVNNLESQQNIRVYPNPASQNAIIEFSSSSSGNVAIHTWDMNGRLVSYSQQEAVNGTNLHYWNATDQDGQPLPNGLYIVHIQTPTRTLNTTIVKR